MSDDEQLPNIVADASQLDVPIRITLYTHMANVVWCLTTLLLGAIPYYHYFGNQASGVGLIASAIVWTVLYALMALATANVKMRTALVCAVLWTFASASLAGFACAMLYNISVLQFVAIAFGQSIALIIYVDLSRKLAWRWAIPCMVLASVLVWAASIYGFIVEDDWFFAGGLVLAAAALVGWNAWRLTKSMDYNMNEEGVVHAILDYYCAPLASVIKRLQR